MKLRHSFAEYLLVEEMTPLVKHEYLDGCIYARPGGTVQHAAITVNIVAAIATQVRDRRCRVLGPDMRIRAGGAALYPDASVVSGKVELEPEDRRGETLLNPIVIVEVLSPSTEDYDRGEKLEHDKRIDSLRDVLLSQPPDRSSSARSVRP